MIKLDTTHTTGSMVVSPGDLDLSHPQPMLSGQKIKMAGIQPQDTNISQGKSKSLVYDKFDKELIRSFRKDLKNRFKAIHERSKYHWDDCRAIQKTGDFFIKTIKIEEEFFENHKHVYCRLLFNTKTLGADT